MLTLYIKGSGILPGTAYDKRTNIALCNNLPSLEKRLKSQFPVGPSGDQQIFSNLKVQKIDENPLHPTIDVKVEDAKFVIEKIAEIQMSEILDRKERKETFLSAEWRLPKFLHSKSLLCKVGLDLDQKTLISKLKGFGMLDQCFIIHSDFHSIFQTSIARSKSHTANDKESPEERELAANVESMKINQDTVLIAVTYQKVEDAIAAQRMLSEDYRDDKNYVSSVFLAFNQDLRFNRPVRNPKPNPRDDRRRRASDVSDSDEQERKRDTQRRFRKKERKNMTSYIEATNRELSKNDIDKRFPLRMLVPAVSVGAIIGKQGKNIQDLQKTANIKRINIDTSLYNAEQFYKKDEKKERNPEKLIWVHGDEKSTSQVCEKIMKVMNSVEDVQPGMDDEMKVPLKLLADDRYVGRLIGTKGHVLKTITDTSNARISISSADDVSQWNGDRQITIGGKLKEILEAEQQISSKLRQVFDYDMTKEESVCHRSSYGPHVYTQEKRFLTIYVPEAAIGNVIGKHGESIRNIMSSTYTKIRIFPEKISGKQIGVEQVYCNQLKNLALYRFEDQKYDKQEQDKVGPKQVHDRVEPTLVNYRKVQIQADFGDQNALPTAQHSMMEIVFDKNVRLQETLDQQKVRVYWLESEYDMKYFSEIQVPHDVMGRIVGKNGRSIQELQKSLHVKLIVPPRTNANVGSSVGNSPKSSSSEERTEVKQVSIKIYGMLTNAIKAQQVIFSMVNDFLRENNRLPKIHRNYNKRAIDALRN